MAGVQKYKKIKTIEQMISLMDKKSK
jgi:hypothetical protein